MRTTDASATVIFMPGQTSKALPITIIADEYDEDDEMFTVTLSGETNATLGNATNRITIKDNDNAPKVSIVEFVTENETDTNFESSVTVTLDRATSKTVTVPYTITATSADANDYTVVAESERQLVFAPDSNTMITATSMEIPYTIIGDEIGEKSEEFTITLGNPTNGDITGEDFVATIRIIDDEAPVLSIGNGNEVTESDQAMAMFPVTANFNANEITVYFTPSDGTGDFLGGNLTDNVMISTTLNFAGSTNAMLAVPIANDDVNEEDGFITVSAC